MTTESKAETRPPEGDDGASPAGATLAALEAALEALQERVPEDIPQWEYCEGVMTALLCTRREVASDEWLPMLFDADLDAVFATRGERTCFLMHWLERESQVRAALEAPVDALDDEAALEPGVLDWRGAVAALPPQERAQALADGAPPPFAQAWAAGFLDAVDYWIDDWTPPRDREIATGMRSALATIGELLKEDQAAPAVNLYDETGEPTVSDARLEAFGEAIWAVYDLYDIARSLGPRVAPAISTKTGRNDPCPCGSGKKYKKCCGA